MTTDQASLADGVWPCEDANGAGGLAGEVTRELRKLAARVPADGPPPVALARQRGTGAAEAIATALATDPTLAERQQRWLDVLGELMRRLAGLARQAASALEHERLAAAGQDSGHLGRINHVAPEELDAVSRRCTELAATITAAALPDWNTELRIRELSSSRMPDPGVLAGIADQLRRAVAPALALAYPDPEAVRLARLADQIAEEMAAP